MGPTVLPTGKVYVARAAIRSDPSAPLEDCVIHVCMHALMYAFGFGSSLVSGACVSLSLFSSFLDSAMQSNALSGNGGGEYVPPGGAPAAGSCL